MPPRCRFANSASPQNRVSVTTEPFRIFFPIGVLASIAGVMLWPMVYGGWIDFYPNEAHARLMIEGFVGCFALGFLGTAFPKMIGSSSLSRCELALLVGASIACVAAHACNFIAVGDSFFLLLWLSFVTCLGFRLACFRESLPPPGFVLAGMGIAAGLVGVVLLLVGRIIILSGFQRALAGLLLNEAFILGPILGIGSFLFPRFFVIEQESERKPWAERARFNFVIGLLLLGTFIFQAAGSETVAPLARAVIVAAILFSPLPLFRRRSGSGSLSSMLRFAVVLLALGTVVAIVDPAARVAARHTLFIGGYGLLLLTVASRVCWGHSGNIELAEGKSRSLQIILVVILLALGTRVVAGFIPAIRVSHHIYAALLWGIAVAIWTFAVLKYVRIADPEDEG